ncbi:MAG: zinc ribbon domain-containing protein [Myxococcales bacterium]|nr:zinc ribbon domain-containing protein [Myxococcales bacterium]
MPIYEYTCDDCGHRFEKLVRSADPAAPACPSCQSAKTHKQLSGFVSRSGNSVGGGSSAAPAPSSSRFT